MHSSSSSRGFRKSLRIIFCALSPLFTSCIRHHSSLLIYLYTTLILFDIFTSSVSLVLSSRRSSILRLCSIIIFFRSILFVLLFLVSTLYLFHSASVFYSTYYRHHVCSLLFAYSFFFSFSAAVHLHFLSRSRTV